MSISLATANPDPRLLDAVRDEAWDQGSTTVIEECYLADISGGSKRRFQVALNPATGDAAVIETATDRPVFRTKASSALDAAMIASRVS